MKKKYFYEIIFLFVLLLFTPFTISAKQPPLPPEIGLLVNDFRYTEDTALIIDQIVQDAALCGIKLNVEIIDYSDLMWRVYFGNFEMVMFSTTAWYKPDSFDTILWLLEFYFGDFNWWGYYNPEIKAKINELELLYLSGLYEEATVIFHEIELLIYEGQYYPAIGYHFDDTLIHTHLLLINNNLNSLFDIAVRKALSFLIDRENYIPLIQTTYSETISQTCHLFGWSQYHDTSLPYIPHSIGKAASTLAKAGYRPCRIK